jgi:hypothetical protein
MPYSIGHYTLGGRPAWQVAGYRSREEYESADPDERDRRLRDATNRIRSRQRNNGEDADQRAYSELYDQLPSVDELSVEYEEDPFVAGPDQAGVDATGREAQWRALQQMEEMYRGGGLTSADRARMELARQQVGQQMRASREADEAALQARGMGGSGMQLASMLGAQQAGATALSQRDAAIQSEAADRAFRAMQGAGALGSGMRSQAGQEASAIDDFNRWQADYARDRSRWNTQQRNRTRESRAGAAQQDYGNKVGIAAGRQGDASAAIGQDQYQQDRTDRWIQAGIGAAGGAASGLARMGG